MFAHLRNRLIKQRKVELFARGFHHIPGKLGHTDDVHPRLFHALRVEFAILFRPVFRIIRGAKEKLLQTRGAPMTRL